MNREVNLTKRVQTPHGWRYCTVVLSANGRVKPDLVLVNGKQETHKEGAYYLEWREGSKRVRLPYYYLVHRETGFKSLYLLSRHLLEGVLPVKGILLHPPTGGPGGGPLASGHAGSSGKRLAAGSNSSVSVIAGCDNYFCSLSLRIQLA